jgi:hypothetical protein
VNSGWKQRKHLRTSKTGKVFNAGSKLTFKAKDAYLYRNIKFKNKDHVEGEEWNSISDWTRFSGYIPLMFIRKALHKSNQAAREIWYYQDGMPGVSASECEWDWSAIRDSSNNAIDRMFEVSKRYVDFDAFMSQLRSAEIK